MLDQPVPDFELPATGGKTFKLSQFKRRRLILYFYPKDNTPGCTTEGMQFRDAYADFQAHHCEIVGISRDSLKSHEGFKTKLALPFDLLSDSEEIACQLFGVMKLKNLYGKQVRGIERSTFVIDQKGTLVKEWRGVKVPNHVQEVLDYIKSS
ncbi:MAG: peroxiredoxin [Pseudomonadota bacterium]